MNARRIALLALMATGVFLALAASSALADPPDLDNPPTYDWVFDSGAEVTISYKTWNINYNFTVFNDTHLVLDNCTFTVYDMYDLNDLWFEVLSDGLLTIQGCTFKSTAYHGYFIYLEGDTIIEGSTFTGLVAGPTMGGIAAYRCNLMLKDTDIKDVNGVAVWAENCNLDGDGLTVTGSGEEGNDGASFMAVYTGNSPGDLFQLMFRDSYFNDNDGRGFGLRSYMNWADIVARFYGCHWERSYYRGFDILWGRDGYADSTNASLDILVSEGVFSENRWDGFRYNQNDVRFDGSASVDITLDKCQFDKGQGSGAFINVNYADQAFNIIVNECDFTDNAVGGRAGLALSNKYTYSVWNAVITNCTFKNNDFYGLHFENRGATVDGGSFHVKNCTFEDEAQSLYIYNTRFNEYFNEFWIEDCSFTKSRESGIQHHLSSAEYPVDIHIHRCHFFNSAGAGIASSGASDQSKDIWWDIKDCIFENLGSYGVGMTLDQMMGGSVLDIYACSFNKTMGIGFMVTDSMSDVVATQTLKVEMTEIVSTPGPAIDARIYGYYGGGLDVYLRNLTIRDAMYDGIKAMANSNHASAGHSIPMMFSIVDVIVSDVEGNGFNIGTSQIDYKGTRLIDVLGLDVDTTNRALTLSGLKGDMRDLTVTGSTLEDLLLIGSDIELYEPAVDSLDAGTVSVLEFGSAKFWYNLRVKVAWDTGAWAENAIVEIRDNQHSLVGTFTQLVEAGIPEILLNSYQFRETGFFTRSPYLINVTFKEINVIDDVNLDMNRVKTVIIADHVQPEVFINDPPAGHVQASKRIAIAGSSYDTESGVKVVRVSIDGVNWYDMSDTTSWEHVFTVTDDDVNDNAGLFTIRAQAWDFANNSRMTIRTVEVDPFPPELRVDYPWNQLETNTPTITVRGVTEAGARVIVNGIDTPVTGTLFQADLVLVEGPNTITVTAYDPLGNQQTRTMEVVLDTLLPYIVLLTPEPGDMFTDSTCIVSGQSEADISIEVNGMMVPPDPEHEDAFSYAITLSRGMNVITVKATDVAGNVMVITRKVLMDDVPPVLAVQSPVSGSYQSGLAITVRGTTDPDSQLFINDVLIVLDNGFFNVQVMGIEGTNQIVVEAMDAAGNRVSQVVTVTIMQMPPVLSVTMPAITGEVVTDPTYILQGTAPGASKVFINDAEYAMEGDAFSVPVTLLEGENRFMIVGQDRAGNRVTSTVSVILDTIPPSLVVRISNLQAQASGPAIYKTEKGKPSTMRVTGYTEGAITVRLNGELVPVAADGYFSIDHSLNVNEVNSLTIVAEDIAGNEAEWTQSIKHEYMAGVEEEGFSWGYLVLIVGLILLIFAAIAGWYRLGKTEQEMEMGEVDEEELLAPAAMPELEEEEEEDLEEEEEEDLEDEEEEVHEISAPPPVRPKTGASRPTPVPSEEVTIEIEDKDLEEKDADADIGAGESEQEGI